MLRMHTYPLLAVTAAGLLALAAGGAYAQSTGSSGVSAASAATPGSDQLEEVTVTAEKRPENIQDVPLSIEAASGADLQSAGINNPVDLGKLVPSLDSNNTLFAAGVIMRIRGFGSAANTATDSDVASYVDSVFIPRPGAVLSTFLDVSSVEVLNGPQGTLFGRNAAMGAVAINTNAPSTDKQSFEVQAQGGNFGTYGGSAVANLPVNDDFAVRVAVNGSHTDGIYHNFLDGKTYGENDAVVGRVSTKWNITPTLTWIVRLDGSHTSGDGAFPEAVDVNTASAAQLAAFTGFITHFAGTPPVYSTTPSYDFNQVFSNPFLHDQQVGIGSDLNWSLSPVLNLRLIDSYRDWNDTQLAGDTVSTSLQLLSVYEGTQSKAQSHELQLVSSKGAYLDSKLGITAGLYYFQENYSLLTNFDLGAQFCNVIYGARAPTLVPVCLGAPQAGAGVVNFGQDATSYAGYFQLNYAIVPNVELDAGIRDTYDKKTGTYSQVTPNSVGISALITSQAQIPLTFDANRPTVRASLSWHLTDKVMAFGTFSTGYKSGGFNNGGASIVLGSAARTFAAETVDDYELGVKSIFWDGKLLLDATLFDTLLHNFQDRSFNGTAFVVRNSGDVRSKGLDLAGQIIPVSHFNLTYGLTYLESYYANDINAPGLEGCTGGPGCPTVQNLTGQPLQFSPRWHGDVGLQWTSGPFMGGYTSSFTIRENYTSNFLTDNNDNPQSLLPSYATTDAHLDFFAPDSRWQFEIFGTNIFDKHYYVATVAEPLGAIMGINNAVTGATLFRGFLGDPARVGVRVSAKF